MRRFTILLLCGFYFLLASGLHLSLHFCGGKLESIGAVASDEVGCCGNKMKGAKKKKCCQEKSFVYQVKNTHQNSAQLYAPKQPVSACFGAGQSQALLSFSNVFTSPLCFDAEKPPVVKPQKIYLSIGNFRI